MVSNENSLLEVRELSVEFTTPKGKLYVLDKISFSVHPKEIVGMVGESGSGKSVTALSILNLLPKHTARITSGMILFHKKDLLKMNEKELRQLRGKKISMIFQEPVSALNPIYPVGKQIRDLLMLHQKLSKREAKQKSIELMQTVGIADPEKRYYSYPHELSGGMCQRILIAMAIACKPELLIADEPTTALDVTIQAQIMDLLLSLKNDFGISIFFITHDLSLVAEYADRVLVIYAGQIMESAPVTDIFNLPLHPYTEALLEAIPSGNKPIKAISGFLTEFSYIPKGCRFSNRCHKALKDCFETTPNLIKLNENRAVRCLLYKIDNSM